MEIEWHKWFNMKTIYHQQELSLTLSQRWPTFVLAHTVSDMDKCIIKNQQMIALLLRLVGHKSNIFAQLMHGRRCSMKHYKECPKNICRIRSIHHHCKMICITINTSFFPLNFVPPWFEQGGTHSISFYMWFTILLLAMRMIKDDRKKNSEDTNGMLY